MDTVEPKNSNVLLFPEKPDHPLVIARTLARQLASDIAPSEREKKFLDSSGMRQMWYFDCCWIFDEQSYLEIFPPLVEAPDDYLDIVHESKESLEYHINFFLNHMKTEVELKAYFEAAKSRSNFEGSFETFKEQHLKIFKIRLSEVDAILKVLQPSHES